MPPSTTAAPASGDATFYLDELDLDSWQNDLNRWENPHVQRFAVFALGGIAATGSAVALAFEGHSLMLWLWLFVGLCFMAQALFLWKRRPFLHVDDEGLTFRLRRLGQEQSVPWGELKHLELRPTTVVLHRASEPALPLRFDTVSFKRLRQLKAHLADTARQYGVSVSPS